MIWWLKSRSGATLLGATVLTALIGIGLGRTVLPVPSLLGSGGDFFLGALITVIPAVLWLSGTGRVTPDTEATALRPVHRLDTALAAALATTALTVTAVAYVLASDDIALMVGRNATFYLAAAVILSPLVGPRAAAPLLTAIPIVLSVAGWRGRYPQPWAIILHPGDSARALAATSAMAAVAGLIGLGVRTNRPLLQEFIRRN
ncbi:hypothetical protein [Streptomyces bambusae]|uniref:ABC transporter permease n=1 Tax=Streptomyces bambusae TaxID=1550616 RepID=A0ABS6Z2D2_9ACTN|nr:hypothetical protein [Streptomyces bambusae]MBW5481903.1 hypothetical protein [Streptomyces bambusae]